MARASLARAALAAGLLALPPACRCKPAGLLLPRRLPGMKEQLLSDNYAGTVEVPPVQFRYPWPGATAGTDTFFWLAEHEEASATGAADSPVVLWIQGGPGSSSVGGGFTELGPLSLDDRSLADGRRGGRGVPAPLLNPHGWSKAAHLLLVEYADTGFSRCRRSQDAAPCSWDDASVAHSLHQFLLRLLDGDMFPELRGSDLWIAGESYAGILVTVLAAVIDHERARDARHRVRLRGVLHGNGAVGHHAGGPVDWWPAGFNTNDMPEDPRHHMEYFWRAGLTSGQAYSAVTRACPDVNRPTAECREAVAEMARSMGDFTAVHRTQWNVYDIYDTCSDMPHRRLRGVTPGAPPGASDRAAPGPREAAEWSATWACGGRAATEAYLNLPEVRAALHVPASLAGFEWRMGVDLNYSCSNDDGKAIAENFSRCPMKDFRPMISELVAKGYGFLVYSGDCDAQVPHTATEAWTGAMGLPVEEAWQPWTLDGFVQGYVTRFAGNFTYATVKGAGHMVPTFRPRAALAMVRRYISSRRLAGEAAQQAADAGREARYSDLEVV